MGATQWTIGGAIEHGSFLMALAAALMTLVAILLAIAGIIAYIRIKAKAKKIAMKEARAIAREVAEREVNLYLQAELPAIMAVYADLGQAGEHEGSSAEVAENQDEGR